MTQQIVGFVNHKMLRAPQRFVGELGGMARRPKTDIKLDFARRLQMARARKYQQKVALARKLGIEAETYNRYERGETEPSIADLGRIACELEVSTDFLILGDLPPPKR